MKNSKRNSGNKEINTTTTTKSKSNSKTQTQQNHRKISTSSEQEIKENKNKKIVKRNSEPSFIKVQNEQNSTKEINLDSNNTVAPSKIVEFTRKKRFSFLLGCTLGICGVLFFTPSLTILFSIIGLDPDLLHEFQQAQNEAKTKLVNIRMPSFDRDFMPEFNFSLPNDMVDQLKELFDFTSPNSQDHRVGITFKRDGVRLRHPVVMIPGIITTGLELWEGEECASTYFRQRIWGTVNMIQQFFTNRQCWARHMILNSTNGLDPDNVKIRAARDFEATDYVIAGYWVWAKLIENLADIGYDTNQMSMMSYDWRLSFQNLEKRDRYLSKLRRQIESLYEYNDEIKVVVVAHSMGSTLFLYFLNWIENINPGWTDKHIHSFVNIGGPLLGTPQGVTRLLTGEVKDIYDLGLLGKLIDLHFPPSDRRRLFRTWGSVYSMLPKGGDSVWGVDVDTAPDGIGATLYIEGVGPLTTQQTIDLLFNKTGDESTSLYQKEYSLGLGIPKKQTPSTWSNVLQAPLPVAPKMKIYCFYGVGKQTERGAFLKQVDSETEIGMDTNIVKDKPKTKGGVIFSEGDGTVPLLSLGLLCVDGWKNKQLNPSGMEVITREIMHSPSTFDPRGGPGTGDHVDIMGNVEVISAVLQIASGKDKEISENRLFSDIQAIASKVNLEKALLESRQD